MYHSILPPGVRYELSRGVDLRWDDHKKDAIRTWHSRDARRYWCRLMVQCVLAHRWLRDHG